MSNSPPQRYTGRGYYDEMWERVRPLLSESKGNLRAAVAIVSTDYEEDEQQIYQAMYRRWKRDEEEAEPDAQTTEPK